MSHPPYTTWMPLVLPESILVTSLKKPSSILCKNFKMMQLQLGTVFAWCSCLSFPVYVSKVTFCHNQWPWIFPLGYCGFFFTFWGFTQAALVLVPESTYLPPGPSHGPLDTAMQSPAPTFHRLHLRGLHLGAPKPCFHVSHLAQS